MSALGQAVPNVAMHATPNSPVLLCLVLFVSGSVVVSTDPVWKQRLVSEHPAPSWPCKWVGFTGHKCSQKNRVSHSVGCFSTLSSLGSVRETTLSFGGKDCAGWPELSRRTLKIWLRTPGACQPHRRPSLGVAYASTRRSPRWGSAMLSSRFPGAYAAWLLTVVPLGLGGRTRWRLACRLCWHILVTHTYVSPFTAT